MDEVGKLRAELESEQETIEDLLNQLQTLELEGRATQEEAKIRENKLKDELRSCTRDLEDERTIRLQQMYMLSRVKEESEVVTNQLKEMQLSSDIQNKEFDKLESSLEFTKRLLQDRDDDLRQTTQANLILKTEALHLQNRLVEADQETSQWRRKYEKLLDTTNKQQHHQSTTSLIPTSSSSHSKEKKSNNHNGLRSSRNHQQHTTIPYNKSSDQHRYSSSSTTSFPPVFDHRK